MTQPTDLFHLESAVDHLRRAYTDGINGADPLEAAQAAGHLGELLHLAGDRLVGAAQILGSFTTEHGLAPLTVETVPSEPIVSAPSTVEARQTDFLAPDLADTSDDSVAAVEAQQEMQQQEVIPLSPENVVPQIDARFDTAAATEIFRQMRRGERLSFVDSRGQVNVGELFSRFGIDKNNFVDNFRSELVDVYGDYRDGPFADMLPAIQFIDGATVRTVDGKEQSFDNPTYPVTLNLLSIISPFGYVSNQSASSILGLSSGAYFYRLNALKKSLDGMYFDSLVPGQRSVAARIRTAGDLGVTSQAQAAEPATEEIGVVDTIDPASLPTESTAEAPSIPEPSNSEAEAKPGKYLDGDGNWDIDALKAYFKDPSASDDKLRGFLGYDILYHDLTAPRDHNDMLIRLEPNKQIRIGNTRMNLEPLERVLVNLMLLTPDGHIDIHKLQAAGILEDNFDKNRAAALEVVTKFNLCAPLGQDILIKMEVDNSDYGISMTQPMRVKEPMYSRTFRSLEKSPAFLGMASS